MPTFVYMTRCDGCGHCVDICPSDIMHIDPTYRRAYNIEPNMCWECYSCVKACPQNAIDVRGYADFAPLGHSVRVLREEAKATVSWRLKFRDGREKNFESPIRTTPWGSIKGPAEYAAPRPEDFAKQELAHEPEALKISGGLPALRPEQLKRGVARWGFSEEGRPYSSTRTSSSSAAAWPAAARPTNPGTGDAT